MGRQRPVELFRTTDGNWLGLQLLLHALRIEDRRTLNDLVRLLQHSWLPFHLFYDSGCMIFMGYERSKDVLETLKSAEMTHLMPVIFSESCLSAVQSLKRAIGSSLIKTFGPGYFFKAFSGSAESPPFMKPSLFYSELREAARHGLVQNCHWMYQANAIHPQPPSKLLPLEPDAWMHFHYSIYASDRFSQQRTTRTWIANLLTDAPKLKKDFDLPRYTRWCLHLSLIMLKLKKYKNFKRKKMLKFCRQVNVFIGSTSYFQNVLHTLSRIIQTETGSIRMFQLKVLRKMISAACKRVSTVQIRILTDQSCDELSFKLPELHNMLDVVLDGLEGEVRDRWILALFEFYGHLEADFWTGYRQSRSLLCTLIEEASPLEQWNWIKLFLSSPHLEFARSTIAKIVKSNLVFQERLLDFDHQEKHHRDFVIEAIPLAKRVKMLRERFIFEDQASFRLHDIFLHNAKSNRFTLTSILSEFYEKLHITGDLRKLHDGTMQFIVIDEVNTDDFVHALTLSLIFSIPIPFKLDEVQLEMLLGFTPLEVGMGFGHTVNQARTVEIINAIQQKIRPLFYPLLSFQELLKLVALNTV